jgi:hypothetical protein
MLRHLALAALVANVAPAAPADGGPGQVPDREVTAPIAQTPATSTLVEARAPARRALARALTWLAKAQKETGDGSFPRGEGKDLEYAPVAITALGALALMAGGSSPTQGPHHNAVAQAVDYLLLHTDLSPASPTRGFISAGGDETSLMHGHGFATLALAEALGMSPKGERIRAALEAAVDLIQRTQGSAGGWFYKPQRQSEHEGSLTVCLLQALRGAREAGVHVDPAIIARAIGYLEKSQLEDGSFAYQIGSQRSSVGLTAAAITSLNATGEYGGSAIARGVDAIFKGLAQREEDGTTSRFPFYERFYLAQAFWQHQDEKLFRRWSPNAEKSLLRTQDQDGSWFDPRFGRAYATAMNALVLAIPDSLLPAFQR